MKKIFIPVFLIILLTFCKIPDDETADPNKVFILNVVATPTEAESITIKNGSNGTVDISHWTLGDLNNPTDYRIPDNRDIDADEEITYPHSTLGFSINDSNETIYLKDSEGNTIDTWSNSYLPHYGRINCSIITYLISEKHSTGTALNWKWK